MQIIDFHSHILPGIDDGARNVQTSLSMLDMVAAQQVDVMIATPHFYASRDRISTFLERRDKAWQSLQRELTGDSVRYPQIIAGAEVAFFDGISKAKEIGLLTIQGTDILLLEMPFQPWTSKQIDEVAFLVRDRGFTVLIAHLERFLWMPGNKKQVEKLLTLPVWVQINAEAFDGWLHTRTLMQLFKSDKAHVLGSDCHGAHHRTPNLQSGRETVRKKAGQDILDRIDRNGEELLAGLI